MLKSCGKSARVVAVKRLWANPFWCKLVGPNHHTSTMLSILSSSKDQSDCSSGCPSAPTQRQMIAKTEPGLSITQGFSIQKKGTSPKKIIRGFVLPVCTSLLVINRADVPHEIIWTILQSFGQRILENHHDFQ